MEALFGIISIPMGYVLRFLAKLPFVNGNFAISVFLFTVLINLAMIPLSIKSQKSSVQQTRIKPKLDELKKRYGDDKQKYSEAMQKLYQEENVSMAGGCLPMILRLVIMMSIYSLILSPLTYLSGVEKDTINNVTTTISATMKDLEKNNKDQYAKYSKSIGWQNNGRPELAIVGIVRNESAHNALKEALGEKEYAKIEKDLKVIADKDKDAGITYNFFTDKINLTESPDFDWNIAKAWTPIWIMPLLAFATQMLSSVLSMQLQKKINPEAPAMGGMLLTMPLISLFIGFALPGGVTFYWACSSLIGGLVQAGLQIFYGPQKMLAKERANELKKQCIFEEGQINKLSEK